MSDIFISYAREDRDKAQALAELFQQQDWSVWWDRNIPPGRSFDAVIEEALGAAKCVVVLWSKNSASSDWVKGEAGEALQRKILVPVRIDSVNVPLEFRRLQTVDLSDWKGGAGHPVPVWARRYPIDMAVARQSEADQSVNGGTGYRRPPIALPVSRATGA